MIDKKKIKKEYKEKIQPMGIYRIVNTVSGKVMIGSSQNLPGKLNSVKFQLEMGSHMNRNLQVDFTAHGSEKFRFEVLDNLKPENDPAHDYAEDLRLLEEMWKEKLLSGGISLY